MVTAIIHLIPLNETDRRLRPISSDLVLTTSSEGVQEQGPQSWKLPLSVFYLRERGRNRCVMLRRMRAASLMLHWNRCSPCSRVVCKYLSQIALGRRKLIQEGWEMSVSASVVLRFSKLWCAVVAQGLIVRLLSEDHPAEKLGNWYLLLL